MMAINPQHRPLQRLDVIYSGWGEQWQLGTLAAGVARGKWLFEYSSEALARGVELSPLLHPLGETTFADFERYQEGVPGFIADSLPDGWGRLLMDRLLRRNQLEPQRFSALDRLALLGENTMGALSYRPSLTLADDETGAAISNLQQLAGQIQLEVSGQESEALAELVRLGGSPHGARPKALIEYHPSSGKVSTLAFSGSEPWLVKFPATQEETWVCALEEVYARMARRAGIDFPPSRFFALGGGLAAFAVKRFDRQQGMRVPVLSIAAALQADFTLPCLDYADVLRATAMLTRSAAEREVQARRMVFNVLMNNRDDHAKNFAFIMDAAGDWRVSPAYDLTFQDGPGGEHQTSVAGQGSGITRAALVRAAGQADIARSRITAIVQEVSAVALTFREVAAELDGAIPAAVIAAVAARIADNVARAQTG